MISAWHIANGHEIWFGWKISWRVRRLCLLGKQMNSNRPNWYFFIMTRNHSLNFKKAFWLKLALKGFRGKKGFSGLKWLKRGLKGFPRKPVYISISNVMEIPVFNLMDNILFVQQLAQDLARKALPGFEIHYDMNKITNISQMTFS